MEHSLPRLFATMYPQKFLNTACPAYAGDDTACPAYAADWRDKHGYFFCNQKKYYSLLEDC
jgi:hypothetical protein